MYLKLIFELDSIVQVGSPVLDTEASPPGVGNQYVASYKLKQKKHVSGTLTQTWFGAHIDKKGHLQSIGSLFIQLCHRGDDITITSTTNIKSSCPSEPLSMEKLATPITSAIVNDLLAQGHLAIKPLDGGKCYKVCVELEPVHRCPPPPCPPQCPQPQCYQPPV